MRRLSPSSPRQRVAGSPSSPQRCEPPSVCGAGLCYLRLPGSSSLGPARCVVGKKSATGVRVMPTHSGGFTPLDGVHPLSPNPTSTARTRPLPQPGIRSSARAKRGQRDECSSWTHGCAHALSRGGERVAFATLRSRAPAGCPAGAGVEEPLAGDVMTTQCVGSCCEGCGDSPAASISVGGDGVQLLWPPSHCCRAGRKEWVATQWLRFYLTEPTELCERARWEGVATVCTWEAARTLWEGLGGCG